MAKKDVPELGWNRYNNETKEEGGLLTRVHNASRNADLRRQEEQSRKMNPEAWEALDTQEGNSVVDLGFVSPDDPELLEADRQRAMNSTIENSVVDMGIVPQVSPEEKELIVKEIEATSPEIQALPRKQRKEVLEKTADEVIAQTTAEGAQQVLQQTLETESQDASPGSLKSKWLDAIKYFSPQIVGMAVGGVLGGRRGAIAGYEEGKGVRKGLDDMQLKFQEMEQKAQKALLSSAQVATNTDLYDTDTGLIVQTNKMGQFISNGQVIPPERVGNLKIDREARTAQHQQDRLDVDRARLGVSRESLEVRKANAERMQKHREWIRSEADELSPQDVRAINAYEQTIQQAGAIAEAFKNVNTGPISGRVQALLEPLGIAPTSYTELKSQGGRLLADWMRSISGTAISENEAKRLQKLLPNVNDPEKVFAAKMVKFVEETQRSMNVFKAGFKKEKGQGSSSSQSREAALKWLKENPNDPRANEIRKRIGL